MTQQYLTEKEVSLITGRKLPTLRKDRHYQRGIPYYKIGRQVRYCLEEVERFMASCRVEPRQQL